MSVRQGMRDGASFAAWWLFGVILVVITIVILALTWSGLAPWQTNRQRQINHNSQQFQDSLVLQERDLVVAIQNANGTDQKAFFTNQFCSQYINITEPPADLSVAYGKLC